MLENANLTIAIAIASDAIHQQATSCLDAH
jgi:hypothetical protein